MHPNAVYAEGNPQISWLRRIKTRMMQKKKGRGCKELHVQSEPPKENIWSSEVKLPHRPSFQPGPSTSTSQPAFRRT
ncbi:hypothetical protein TNCT_584901 [Trichonephila clavata]|uniref:Uncharacterized protein n=1 Tax=Trichonephila clavata TaxID=2740835 RepID=A0A8X6HP14_TRICU|nr:hypothetical protein TNCT_584901 [Trichonephila clavata]